MTYAQYAADIESSVELLRTIAAVLDIRAVFPQVSEIANKVLPHDLLTMMFHDRGGQILVEAASTDEFRGLTRFTKAGDSKPDEGYVIIDDFTTAILPIVDPVDLRERIVAAGFRSLLVVLTRARHQDMGLGFWSKQSHAFSRDDVSVARRIADHVALAVSHEQLAEAARQVAEARGRAERLEARVQSLAEDFQLGAEEPDENARLRRGHDRQARRRGRGRRVRGRLASAPLRASSRHPSPVVPRGGSRPAVPVHRRRAASLVPPERTISG